MDFVLGIDGGGTKTAAVILSQDGSVVGYGEAGASTFGVVPVEQTQKNIAEAVRQACLQASLQVRILALPFRAAFLGLGNVVSAADRQAICEIAQKLHLFEGENVGVDHDIRVALAGGLSGRAGIVLILGTGSSCYGINASGKTWRAGGWGPLIDDGGSSYWLGLQAMHAAIIDFDGRGPATQITALLLEAMQLQHLDDIMNRLYAQNMTRTEIGLLNKVVLTAAGEGDSVAQAIIQAGCEALAECVRAVAHKLEMDAHPCEVALTGGLTNAGSIYLDPLEWAIQARLPESQVLLGEMLPVLGAGLLALQLLAPALPASVIHNLQSSHV